MLFFRLCVVQRMLFITLITQYLLQYYNSYYYYYYYRAMHFSAKRGIAVACRLSVCLSVCL